MTAMDNARDKETYHRYSVFQIMTPSPITITPETTAGEAMRIMQKNGFHHLPVTENDPSGTDRLVGIVAKGDLQRVISVFAGSKIETERDRRTPNLRVKAFMIKEVATLPADAGIRQCVDLFLAKQFNSVPIVDPETARLVGIVTSSDLIQFLHNLLGRGMKKG